MKKKINKNEEDHNYSHQVMLPYKTNEQKTYRTIDFQMIPMLHDIHVT